MTLIRFLRPDGSTEREVEAEPGARLLDVAQKNGQPLEGTCEGAMACSTCHVILAREDFDRLPPASEEEDDLLDFAPHVSATSRLACQVEIPADGTLTVRMPGAAKDWSR
ncbi:2Fe-2S iron-sulfur cluster-binding protein [Sphingomicrobium arenosum]|uniref:2Fe-2S iron-sulfur cluster-binding protein n=1 Tax=Sphingomicrobium arenosum TaxID=2233861 RepID=UPI00223FF441|nr:2Fe-2S iron-sulfur cluster-binding protein [Sphingomicrobium arenosum]